MKFFRMLMLAALLPAFAADAAQPIEFKSVGADPAVAYDAPSVKGRKVFVAPRGMPVETVLTYGDWTKVRDSAGDLFWLESKSLVPKRMLIVKAPNAKVHARADDASALTFSADKGVLLELAEPLAEPSTVPTPPSTKPFAQPISQSGQAAALGWLKVRHRDGQNGYVKGADVWGGG
ncbi:MAG: SH3 domain-containing protein [Burkholderiales bacterium]